MDSIQIALEKALGLSFDDKKGKHFFYSTLVQTIFYGIFSAWVLWCKENGYEQQKKFSWKEAVWYLHVPMIKALFEQIAMPTKLGPLRLVEVLDWTGAVLNRIDKQAFFSRFEEDNAVQYFYEPFLEAFDPVLRKDLGVWYTPSEIVKYMVARVDMVLREELGIEDGLADPSVYVLDPCCGTGAYLIEVLKHIATTLHEKGDDALVGSDLKTAATERIFGFEILPAPFVVAHLQLGLLLQNFGVPLSDEKEERVGVYLTNALTGWEPPDKAKEKVIQLQLEGIPELQEERDAAGQIKREVPILVILGNPPYNAFAGVSPEEEQGMVEIYKEGLTSQWGIRKYNLDDLYVRFLRLAEHRIIEGTGKGLVCYISNFSYLGDPSYVVMRERFLKEFDSLWFDSMNGDSRETGKLTPDGKPDPSVFSTDHNRAGIRLGTTVGLMVRKTKRNKQSTVYFRDFWGAEKRENLLESLQANNFNAQYSLVPPDKRTRYSFRKLNITEDYLGWPSVVELCEKAPISGLQEMRRGALMGINRETLEERIRSYFDPSIDWNVLASLGTGLTINGGRFDAIATRKKLQEAEKFNPERIIRYTLYPFDPRWCYYSTTRPLWNEPRPELAEQNWEGNSFFVSRMMAERPNEQVPMMFTTTLPDYHLLRPNAVAIPIRLRLSLKKRGKANMQAYLFETSKESEDTCIANLSKQARGYLTSLGIDNPDADTDTASLLWMHALAIGFSPAYLIENKDGIHQGWPRVPLPSIKALLFASALLGTKLAALLNMEKSVPSLTSGKILQRLASIAHVEGKALNPDAGDLAISVGWGHPGDEDIVMPGKGKLVERSYTTDELSSIKEGLEDFDLTLEQAIEHLGENTCDMYLNKIAYWKNVPVKVWDYRIGGYQIIKKWLSYREQKILGRALSREEVREMTSIVRRIAAILLLEPHLDSNYEAIKNSTYSWLWSNGV